MKLFDYIQKAISLQFDMVNAAMSHASKSVEQAQAHVAELERIGKRALEV